MHSDAAGLFMHPQSCTIEEIQDETCDSLQSAPHEPEAVTTSPPEPDQHAGEVDCKQGPHLGDEEAQRCKEATQNLTICSDEEVDFATQQLLDECERLKQEGNAAYASGDYDEALQLYWQVNNNPAIYATQCCAVTASNLYMVTKSMVDPDVCWLQPCRPLTRLPRACSNGLSTCAMQLHATSKRRCGS